MDGLIDALGYVFGARVKRWPRSWRNAYADRWALYVIPLWLVRVVFFIPFWGVLTVISVVNTIPLHIDAIREGENGITENDERHG